MDDSEKLKVVRKHLGLTQSEMASKMGYGSQQYISLIENGDRNMSGVARKCLQYLAELNDIDELKELVYLANKEIYKLASALSQNRTGKTISKHGCQVQLKIIASAERLFYDN